MAKAVPPFNVPSSPAWFGSQYLHFPDYVPTFVQEKINNKTIIPEEHMLTMALKSIHRNWCCHIDPRKRSSMFWNYMT